jgi:hypothetical protein
VSPSSLHFSIFQSARAAAPTGSPPARKNGRSRASACRAGAYILGSSARRAFTSKARNGKPSSLLPPPTCFTLAQAAARSDLRLEQRANRELAQRARAGRRASEVGTSSSPAAFAAAASSDSSSSVTADLAAFRRLLAAVAAGFPLPLALSHEATLFGGLQPRLRSFVAELGLAQAAVPLPVPLFHPVPVADVFLTAGPGPSAVLAALLAHHRTLAHPPPRAASSVFAGGSLPGEPVCHTGSEVLFQYPADAPLPSAGIAEFCFPSAPALRPLDLAAAAAACGYDDASARAGEPWPAELQDALFGKHGLRRGPRTHMFVLTGSDADAADKTYTRGITGQALLAAGGVAAEGRTRYCLCITVTEPVTRTMLAAGTGKGHGAGAASSKHGGIGPAARAAASGPSPAASPPQSGSSATSALEAPHARLTRSVHALFRRQPVRGPGEVDDAGAPGQTDSGAAAAAEEEEEMVAPSGPDTAALLVPRVLCLVSRYPFFPLHFEVLRAAAAAWRAAALARLQRMLRDGHITLERPPAPEPAHSRSRRSSASVDVSGGAAGAGVVVGDAGKAVAPATAVKSPPASSMQMPRLSWLSPQASARPPLATAHPAAGSSGSGGRPVSTRTSPSAASSSLEPTPAVAAAHTSSAVGSGAMWGLRHITSRIETMHVHILSLDPTTAASAAADASSSTSSTAGGSSTPLALAARSFSLSKGGLLGGRPVGAASSSSADMSGIVGLTDESAARGSESDDFLADAEEEATGPLFDLAPGWGRPIFPGDAPDPVLPEGESAHAALAALASSVIVPAVIDIVARLFATPVPSPGAPVSIAIPSVLATSAAFLSPETARGQLFMAYAGGAPSLSGAAPSALPVAAPASVDFVRPLVPPMTLADAAATTADSTTASAAGGMALAALAQYNPKCQALVAAVSAAMLGSEVPLPGAAGPYPAPDAPPFWQLGCDLDHPETARAITEWAAPVLFSLLPVDSILLLVGAALTEQKIVLVGGNLSQESVASCVLALALLLRPLAWVGPFLPTLPPSLLDITSAPIPIMVGVPSLPPTFEADEATIVVLLDRETVRIPAVRKAKGKAGDPWSRLGSGSDDDEDGVGGDGDDESGPNGARGGAADGGPVVLVDNDNVDDFLATGPPPPAAGGKKADDGDGKRRGKEGGGADGEGDEEDDAGDEGEEGFDTLVPGFLDIQLPANSALHHELEPLSRVLRNSGAAASGHDGGDTAAGPGTPSSASTVRVLRSAPSMASAAHAGLSGAGPTVYPKPCYRPTPEQTAAASALVKAVNNHVRALVARILAAGLASDVADGLATGRLPSARLRHVPTLAACAKGLQSDGHRGVPEVEQPFWARLLSSQMLSVYHDCLTTRVALRAGEGPLVAGLGPDASASSSAPRAVVAAAAANSGRRVALDPPQVPRGSYPTNNAPGARQSLRNVVLGPPSVSLALVQAAEQAHAQTAAAQAAAAAAAAIAATTTVSATASMTSDGEGAAPGGAGAGAASDAVPAPPVARSRSRAGSGAASGRTGVVVARIVRAPAAPEDATRE